MSIEKINQRFQLLNEPVEILEFLSDQIPDWEIEFHPEHPSTQILAREAFKNGIDKRTLFFLRKQTAGRGRKTRSWVSSPDGLDLVMTLLIPAKDLPDNPAMMSLVGGFSVAEALREITSCKFQVKWPNDVFFGNAKVCGILSELMISGNMAAVAMGIGINVNSKPDAFDTTGFLYEIETMSSVYGNKIDLARLIVEIIEKVEINFEQLLKDSSQFLQKWNLLGWNVGGKIKFRELGEDWKVGKISGLTPQGYLIIMDESGEFVHNLIEGDIVPIYS